MTLTGLENVSLRLDNLRELILLRRLLVNARNWNSDAPEAEALLDRVNAIYRQVSGGRILLMTGPGIPAD